MATEARSKFGAPVFEPEAFRKQIHCVEKSSWNTVGTFRHPGHCGPFAFFIVWASSDAGLQLSDSLGLRCSQFNFLFVECDFFVCFQVVPVFVLSSTKADRQDS